MLNDKENLQRTLFRLEQGKASFEQLKVCGIMTGDIYVDFDNLFLNHQQNESSSVRWVMIFIYFFNWIIIVNKG